MSYVSYPTTSAYAATPQRSSFIGRYVHREIIAAVDDTYITIDSKYNNRPDLLAYDLYGNPNYWWVFCSRNIGVIRDPIWDFTTGKEIAIPSKAHLKAILG